MTETKTQSNGCGCSGSSATEPAAIETRTVKIDFLYLDLESCVPCQGSEGNLEDALNEISTLLGTPVRKWNSTRSTLHLTTRPCSLVS